MGKNRSKKEWRRYTEAKRKRRKSQKNQTGDTGNEYLRRLRAEQEMIGPLRQPGEFVTISDEELD